MAIEIVDLPSYKNGDLPSYKMVIYPAKKWWFSH